LVSALEAPTRILFVARGIKRLLNGYTAAILTSAPNFRAFHIPRGISRHASESDVDVLVE
jgi:hypothetical protein